MILFGYESKEQATSRYIDINISESLVRSIANSSFIKVGAHTIVGLIISAALYDASDRMRGFNATVIEILSALASFYVFFGLVVLYAIWKTRRQALQAIQSQSSYYNESSERRKTFWTVYRELFPPNWQ
jgi:hypothetical protein